MCPPASCRLKEHQGHQTTCTKLCRNTHLCKLPHVMSFCSNTPKPNCPHECKQTRYQPRRRCLPCHSGARPKQTNHSQCLAQQVGVIQCHFPSPSNRDLWYIITHSAIPLIPRKTQDPVTCSDFSKNRVNSPKAGSIPTSALQTQKVGEMETRRSKV